jgi:Flp pilus assembly protein TadB
VTKVGSLRASDADREQIVSRLHAAATEGRIAADELEQRVSAALTARTYGELDATVADLPSQLGQRPRRQSGRRSSAHWVLSAVRANPLLLLFAIPVLAVTAAMLLTIMIVWAVLMVLVMVLGGRPRAPRGPWVYTRQRRPCGPPRHRANPSRSYWA